MDKKDKKGDPEKEPMAHCDFPVVGIGASAGGLDSLQQLFAAIPQHSGLAFVVVSHLSPAQKSYLPELLAKHTPLQVMPITDGVRVRPDSIYVIPPNADVQIRHCHLRLTPSVPSQGPQMRIDRFFASLAEAQRSSAIGVILSGTGSDGTAGSRKIKEAGGKILVQEELSAQFTGMPHSVIEAGLADFVLPIEDLAAQLKALQKASTLLNGDGTARDLCSRISEMLPSFIEIVRTATGSDFSCYKNSTIVRRIARRVAMHNLSDSQSYLDQLRDQPQEVDALSKDLLISVTHFFRDKEAFASLRDKVVAQLVKHSGQNELIKIWVVGCSNGKEAYSVGILLLEELERQQRSDLSVQIFATDLEEGNIATARQGIYSEEITEEMSKERLERFFVRSNQHYHVTKELRELVIFAPHNLTTDSPFSKLDLVCCRNLLIYIESFMQKKVFPLFHYALKPGGFLFLGISESIGGHGGLFTTVDKKWKIYQRKESGEPFKVHFPLSPVTYATPERPERPEMNTSESNATLGIFAERELLARYAPPAVIINEKLEVVHFPSRTSKYLEPPIGEASLKILGMVRKELRSPLRAAIRNAYKEKKPVRSRTITITTDGKKEQVSLLVEPLPCLSGMAELALIVFESVLDPPQKEKAGPRPSPNWEEERKSLELQVKQLEEEQRITSEQLQSTIEALEASNEELKSSNEELMSMNEELQSTNEEIESSREELQAVNEELVTVNSELELKIEELSQAHSNIHNLLISSQIATIFLDRNLCVKLYTPAATELFHFIPADRGRPLHHISCKFADLHPNKDAEKVLKTLEVFEREVESTDGRWYLLRILPYRTITDSINGVVLTLVDISERKAAEQERAILATIVETSSDAILGVDSAGTIVNWNPGAERLFGYSPEEAIGRSLVQLIAAEDIQAQGQLLDHLQRKKRIALLETACTHKKGNQVNIGLSLSPASGPDRANLAASVIARDITLRLQNEQALRQAKLAAEDADRAKTEFITNISHEIRTPMTTIIGATELLLETEPTELQRNYLAMLESSSEYLLRLIEGILDYSMLDSGQFTLIRRPFDPRQVIRHTVDTMRMLADKKGLNLSYTDSPDIPNLLIGDEARVSQILINLLDNALKFTSQGEVSVQVDRPDYAAEDPGLIWLRFSIQDTGIGILPEKQNLIFQRFSQADGSSTRRFGGVGLGLAICKALVEEMGGTIEVRSEEKKGSRFQVSLPFVQEAQGVAHGSAHRTETTLTTDTAAAGHGQILVAEDDPHVVEIISDLLEGKGWTVHQARDGRSALQAIAEKSFDLALLDLQLPEMDGYELSRKIRERERLTGGHLPILAVTAHAKREDQEQCVAAGMDAWLPKPFHSETLVRTIERLLAKQKQSK